MVEALEEKITGIFRESIEVREVIPTHVVPSGRLTGEIKAVLFDIYGTLFISASGDISAPGEGNRQDVHINGLLRRFGIGKNAAEVERDFFDEVKREHRRLKGEGIDFPEVRYEEIWSAVLGVEDMEVLKTFAVYYETMINPVYPMPGLSHVLSVLKERGVVMGIISNAQFFTPMLFPAFLEKGLEELGFDRRLVFYSYTYRRSKPSDYMYLKAREELESKGIEPDQVVYIGNDMLKDIMPARGVGFKTVLFAGDRRSLRMREDDDRCKGIVPDQIITDLSQIKNLS